MIVATYTYTLRVGLDRIGHEPVIYEASMNDSTSTAFRKLLGPTKDALDRTLMQSDLRDIYRGLKIAGFTPDPTKVEFHVQLSDNANETRLKEVLRKYLIGSNYSLGGTEVFASKNLDVVSILFQTKRRENKSTKRSKFFANDLRKFLYFYYYIVNIYAFMTKFNCLKYLK